MQSGREEKEQPETILSGSTYHAHCWRADYVVRGSIARSSAHLDRREMGSHQPRDCSQSAMKLPERSDIADHDPEEARAATEDEQVP